MVEIKQATIMNIINILSEVFKKLLSNNITSSRPNDIIHDNSKTSFHLNENFIERKINLHSTTEDEKEIIKEVFEKSTFFHNATTYEDEEGNIYVNDGGLLCGVIYKIDKEKNISIYARK